MAERKFDYENIATIYKDMQNITGSASDPTSIAGILHSTDKEFHELVDVSEEAIYGDLGKQLLLDWENTSANFPNFVTNFNNWATLVAQSAGQYAQFEKDVAGFKQANPLGTTSHGATSNYIDSSFYKQYETVNAQSFKSSLSNLKGLYDLTGVQYQCSDSKSILEQHKIVTGIVLGADALALIWAGLAASATVPAAGATAALPGGEPTPVLPGGEPTPVIPGANTALSLTDEVAAAGAKVTGQTALLQTSNGDLLVTTVTNNAGNYMIESTINGQSQTTTLIDFVQFVKGRYPEFATASTDEILAACGFTL